MKNHILVVVALVSLSSFGKSQSAWVNLSIGQSNCIGISFPTNEVGYIFRADGVILKTFDSGNNWSTLSTNTQNLLVGKFSDSLLGAFWGIPPKITTNGGSNWIIMNYNFNNLGMGFSSDLLFINQHTGYLVGGDFYPLPNPCCVDGTINKTTNSGANWIEVFRGGNPNLEVIFKGNDSGIVLSQGELVITTNAGNTWTFNNTIRYNFPFFSAKSMTNPFKDTMYISGYLAGDYAMILKSTNKGESFSQSYRATFKSSLRKVFFFDNVTGYSVGDSGLIVHTSNGGESWQVQNSNTRRRLNGVSFINKDTGFVVGDSGLILRTYTGGIITSAECEFSVVPQSFRLHQNYPNPFNPKTIINYELRIRNFVVLKVYDIAGREVATLVNEIMPAGKHSVEFNAEDLSSGVYFYTLRVSNLASIGQSVFEKTLRMVVIK